MKKMHILALVGIAVAICVLISFMGDVTTYETVASAREKEGKTVTVIAKLAPGSLQYNPATNPNFVGFTAVDSLGGTMPVAYYFEKPTDMEKSDRIVLKGKMENGTFQIRDKQGILLKCPSKYKDDMQKAGEQLQQSTTSVRN
ncbi:MAG: hypothetical protein EAZ47_03405 [Bacteroidetes bacterium]|nr:MAG: hypothetical protein EAY72_14085 [Bacteroidota bacterium]TAE72445.1 MAG: hypothetical protein EAY68_01155 [Bacteroidota bacterium]TAF95228.1 MAG: hypothetical protein EAZ47_03405 [Bacteroidota bacterium]